MVNIKRLLAHLFFLPGTYRRAFPASVLQAIEAEITASETLHNGELRFAVETTLPFGALWHGMSGRLRALEVFSNLRVWDTEANSGVLIYLLLADHDIEIIADRGIAARVDQREWDQIAKMMEQAFAAGQFEQGALAGIHAITHLLVRHFPPNDNNPNELSDQPVLLRR
mgnify:FL=1